jgi:hypothetical protein
MGERNARNGASTGASIGAALGSRSGPFGAGIGAGFGAATGYIAGALVPDCPMKRKMLPDGGHEPGDGDGHDPHGSIEVPVRQEE